MREILFRAKSVNDLKWVEGFYVREAGHFIKELPSATTTPIHLVFPETVGQYTGLKDKKGNRIFEGDIVRYKWDKGREYCHVIKFEDGEFCATPTQHLDDLWAFRIGGENKKFTVIGNIHDNPELLRQTKLREAGK